jgi:hypothetical protein
MRWIPLSLVTLFLLLSPTARAAQQGFELKDTPGQYLDILLDGKIAARYMYAHDTSTKEKRLETYKPYLHVFDAEGKEPITQGAGGKQFPHHRGIYIGWKKIAFEGKQYNLWEMASGDIVHEKFLNQHADADSATFTSLTHWILNKPGTTIIDEERTMTFHRAPAPGRLIIDFTSKLTAPAGDLVLDADPEHGGVQYRPAGDIVAKETVYEFPTEHADPHKDKDYAWAAETYTLRGHRYSVVEINSPENPTGTRWSAYRDYGRFGAFPKASLKKGDSLTLKYRFLIAEGEMPPADYIQKQANNFTGLSTPTPKTTLRPADGAKPTTPKKPK